MHIKFSYLITTLDLKLSSFHQLATYVAFNRDLMSCSLQFSNRDTYVTNHIATTYNYV